MNIDKNWLKSFILNVVKPLKSGKSVDQDGTQAGLNNLFPDGYSNKFRLTSPFGIIAKLPVGVTAFYQGLFGSGHESVILALLHKLRPEPSAPGETILYSTNAAGNVIKVKITLKNDGSLEIDCPTTVNISATTATVNASVKAIVEAPAIELGGGALEKTLNGETFLTLFKGHRHSGNLGYPTSAPIDVVVDDDQLSQTVQAAK